MNSKNAEKINYLAWYNFRHLNCIQGGQGSMRRFYDFAAVAFILFGVAASGATAQETVRETFTGTVLSYGTGFNTRTTTNTFTLIITGVTTDEQAQRSLSILQENGQDALLKNISDQEVGRFSVGSRVGRAVNVVRASDVDGKKRIFAVFERWIQFGELRGGYRSVDYPFSVIELFIDPRTGKGEGTLIEAAQIRWKTDNKTSKDFLEIENFATYPSKLMGVAQRGRRPL